jgi:hypothetical protein
MRSVALDFPVCVGGDEGVDSSAAAGKRLAFLTKSVQKKWLLNHILGDRLLPGAASFVSGGVKVSSAGRSVGVSRSQEYGEGKEGKGRGVHVDGGRRLNYEPCEDDYMTKYLNKPEVKKAFNVNPDIVWKMCSSKVR